MIRREGLAYQPKEHETSPQKSFEGEENKGKILDLEEGRKRIKSQNERERILEVRETERSIEPADYHSGEILTQKEQQRTEAWGHLNQRFEIASRTVSQEKSGTIGRDLQRVKTEIEKVENQYKKYKWNPFAWNKRRAFREQLTNLQAKALKREVAYTQVSFSISPEQEQQKVLKEFEDSFRLATNKSTRKALEQQISLLKNQIEEEKSHKELLEQKQMLKTQEEKNQEPVLSREESLILKEIADLERRMQQEKQHLRQSMDKKTRQELEKSLNWNYNRAIELRRQQIELRTKEKDKTQAS